MAWIAGYADGLTYRAGDTVHVRTSTDAPRVRVDLVRVISGDVNPDGPGAEVRPVASVPVQEVDGREQPVHPGSYAVVPPSPALAALRSFTVTAWIWPTALGRTAVQGLVSTAAPEGTGGAGGFALAIADRRLTLVAGDARLTLPEVLHERQWAFVAATYDARTGQATLSLDSPEWPAQRAEVTGTLAVSPTAGPLVFAALGVEDGHGVGCYDGKIEAPALLPRVCDADERARLADGVRGGGFVGAWAFEEDMSGTRIVDRSGHGLHGELFQMPTRAMTGHGWDSSSDVHAAPHQYGAIHFHSDDIEDAGWDLTASIRLPDDLPSGVYAARCAAGDDVDHVVFFVAPDTRVGAAPAAGRPAHPEVAILFPTVSYMAYANDRMLDNPKLEAPGWLSLPIQRDRGDQILLAHPEYGSSIYETHSDGSGISYSSWKRPVLNMRPDHRNWQTHAPRALSCDLYIVHWLETEGVAHDTLTDHLLHDEGVELLRNYRVVITGTHPEYWTTPMRDALEQWLGEGGRLMYLGGNGFYWVTSVHPTRPHVVEVRRGIGGTRTWESRAGELRHSTTLEMGGLWRYRGKDPNRLVGNGFAAQGFDVPSPGYAVVDGARASRAGWILDGVKDVFGEHGLILDGAAGDEIDRVDPRWGSPPHVVVLATSKGRHSEFMQLVSEDIPVTHPNVRGDLSDDIRADLCFMETGNGGAVFSVGSMNWCGSLYHQKYDNDVARVSRNVLQRFLDPAPFPDDPTAPAAAAAEAGTGEVAGG
ncbi:MAG TPA: N,N-dimethylformamidase beta subunit family domain-containing protein [Acidimicrobiales bacterium]